MYFAAVCISLSFLCFSTIFVTFSAISVHLFVISVYFSATYVYISVCSVDLYPIYQSPSVMPEYFFAICFINFEI